MRVLSFIPAFLVAAASFAAAAPASTPVDTSCVSSPTGGNGGDVALQPVMAIIANASTYIEPLNAELANMKGDSCTPEAVSGVVVKITAVVTTCIAQLQAVAEVDLTGLDVSDLCTTIYAHLSLMLTVLDTLVAIVLALRTNAVGTVQTVICNLLDAVIHLVGCLDVFVDASITGVLGPVVAVVNDVAGLLLSLVIKLNVLLN